MIKYISSSNFIQCASSLESKTELPGKKELLLELYIKFDENHQCHCTGFVSLKDLNTHKILRTHPINDFIFQGTGCFLGAWDQLSAKKGFSYNLASKIPIEEFGEVANQTILEFLIYPNGLFVSTDISEVTIKGVSTKEQTIENK